MGEVFAPLHDPPQEFKELFEDPLFLVKLRSCNSIFPCTSMGAPLMENARIDEQLAKAPEDMYVHAPCSRNNTAQCQYSATY
jgi:hypothetical protein